MEAKKLGGDRVFNVERAQHVDPGAPGEDAKPHLQTKLPPIRSYGQHNGGAASSVGPEGITSRLGGGFGLQVPDEFGALPLDARVKLAQDVALKRRRKIEGDDAARLAGWREDYGKHLVETSLIINAGRVRFGDHDLVPLEGAKGRTTLGIYVLDHPNGPRIIKLLPQTGFHDALAGNLLAEKIGGPKIHRFGRLEVEGGTDRLQNYHAVMFLEMEQLHPGEALGRLKEILKEIKNGAQPRLSLEQLAAGFAEKIRDALLAGVSPNDPDALFNRDGKARVIDGDFYTPCFDPEETISMLRLAFREHGWHDFRAPFAAALDRAIREAPIDDRKRRNLLEAIAVF